MFALKEDNLLLNQFLSVPDTDMISFKELSGKLESRLALESGGEKLELKSSVFESISDSESLSDAIGEIRLNMGDSSLENSKFEENKPVSRKWAWSADDSEMPDLQRADFKDFLDQIQEKEKEIKVVDVYNSISNSEFWPSVPTVEKRKKKKQRKSKIKSKNTQIGNELKGISRKDSQETLSEEVFTFSDKLVSQEFEETHMGVTFSEVLVASQKEVLEKAVLDIPAEKSLQDSIEFKDILTDDNLLHSTRDINETHLEEHIEPTKVELENDSLQTITDKPPGNSIGSKEIIHKDSQETLSEEKETLSEEKETVDAVSHKIHSKEINIEEVSSSIDREYHDYCLADDGRDCVSMIENEEIKQHPNDEILEIHNHNEESSLKEMDDENTLRFGINPEISLVHQPEFKFDQTKNPIETLTRKKSTNQKRKKNKEKPKKPRHSPKITSKIIKQGESPSPQSHILVDNNSAFNLSSVILPESTLSDMIRTAPVNDRAMPEYEWNLLRDSPPPQSFYDQEYYCYSELCADIGIQVTPKSDFSVDIKEHTQDLHDFDSQETFSDFHQTPIIDTEPRMGPYCQNIMKEKEFCINDFSTTALHPAEYQNHGLIHPPPLGYTYVRTLGYIPMSEIPYPIYILVPLTELYPDLQRKFSSDVYDVSIAETFLLDRNLTL